MSEEMKGESIMGNDEGLRLQADETTPGRLVITVALYSWNEDSVTTIHKDVLAAYGFEDVTIRPFAIPQPPGTVRITNSRDVIVAFSTTMPTEQGAAFCRDLVTAAMNHFVPLDLSRGTVAALGGMGFFDGTQYEAKT